MSDQNLATLSLNASKPTKSQAQDILNAIHTGESQDVEKDLARLYRYFMPPAPKKPKTDWDWVAQACAKNDARVYLQYVHVTETAIEATDGKAHRMSPNDRGIEPGFWCPRSGGKVELGMSYPDTSRVIPARGVRRAVPARERGSGAMGVHGPELGRRRNVMLFKQDHQYVVIDQMVLKRAGYGSCAVGLLRCHAAGEGGQIGELTPDSGKFHSMTLSNEYLDCGLVLPVGDWIENDGSSKYPPVPFGMRVDVEHRDGLAYPDEPAGTSAATNWKHHGYSVDIVGYRIRPEQFEDQDMTPAQAKGWKIGDQGRVTKQTTFSAGSVVELYRDDGSEAPLFKLVSGWTPHNVADGKPGAYLHIDRVERIEEGETVGSKYSRTIRGTAADGSRAAVTVDVYDVLEAFGVTDPALQHLVKKALAAGDRGHKSAAEDRREIIDSARRSLELELQRQEAGDVD